MSDESTVPCPNCKRDIASINYQMHVVHCLRNILMCPKCVEPVHRSALSEHDLEFHSEVKCLECGRTFERSSLDEHKTKDCPKRQKQCQFCELELKADTMDEHEEYCGSRTESCEVCNQIVMLKYQRMHEDSGHRKTKPDEDKEDSSSDEGDDVYADYARNGRNNRNENRRADSRRGFDLDYDLPKSLQNMELDHARNTATIRPHLPPPPKPKPNSFQEKSDFELVPCEFCNILIPFEELVLHSTACRHDLFVSPASAESRESTVAQMKNHSAFRPTGKNVTLIPCEFCQKPFDLDIFDYHQRACQNRTAVPAPTNRYGYYEDDD